MQDVFTPPTAAQTREHLKRCTPRPPANPRRMLMGMIVVVLACWLLLRDHWLTLVIPWTILIGMIIYAGRRGKRRTRLEGRARQVYELSLLRRPMDVVREAWSLLPDLTTTPHLHGQTVSLMAAALMRVHDYDAAAETCDYLLDHLPKGTPASNYVRLLRIMAYLHVDRLADADDEIRSLARADLAPIESAMLTTGRLYQQIKTHHFEDAAAADDRIVEQLRPLGVDAGYAYGLIAAAFQQRADDAAARKWWRRATLLLSPAAIMNDLPETKSLAALPPAPSLANMLSQTGGVYA
ncbi:MAG: hypothetical protein GC162_07370 [Planctomycetes bacterium]|nr:hypothetical protein [Planctomycetota bacterium]